ncbi:UvrB/UvrC motif-containing protein [Rubritalea tangerina]|uniref:UvrB/UvrC motif-containing protein n=2 Tax=Rubritalea tangerina TaxID=430798 RepID=A0ABW4ZCP7_9BACT
MDETPEQAQPAMVADVAQSCEQCGFTLEDYRKVGRLGCSACYQAFRAEIVPALAKMHHGVKHQGKVPSGLADTIALSEQLEALKAEQREAIEKEDFEAAAKLRDQIHALEGKEV